MGIYAAPPNRRRNPPRGSDVLGWIAVALTIASVVTFALVGGAAYKALVGNSAWRSPAGPGAADLFGPSRRSIDSYSPRRETTEEIDEVAERPAASRPPGAKLGTHRRQQPRTRRPVSVAERQATRARHWLPNVSASACRRGDAGSGARSVQSPRVPRSTRRPDLEELLWRCMGCKSRRWRFRGLDHAAGLEGKDRGAPCGLREAPEMLSDEGVISRGVLNSLKSSRGGGRRGQLRRLAATTSSSSFTKR